MSSHENEPENRCDQGDECKGPREKPAHCRSGRRQEAIRPQQRNADEELMAGNPANRFPARARAFLQKACRVVGSLAAQQRGLARKLQEPLDIVGVGIERRVVAYGLGNPARDRAGPNG